MLNPFWVGCAGASFPLSADPEDRDGETAVSEAVRGHGTLAVASALACLYRNCHEGGSGRILQQPRGTT
ncbi:hypothetical protein Caci_7243 [Catenulispora acidiphila DSM 44928]|uniref:Uncharacterized protein n=1 Tax=Catenulispora acidiphila (strain DSM 44928 / JCM 14897 / NBRC 102108 / NRRL B-24433 / ID139908) TaxID=479433 RepID=C7Q884_CATAD|nr:hypothetical protein Caci_7243 [Catenulispora acidiphila DSM 44928]